ncbi:polyprotein [Plasmopara halstedii]|uniref:Polyprotein n=1 Tax=Plasmopara halstedii TaxID=4781 RepID=A0A0P1B4K7_PLAHL|nr:polyprotein [Plasmopara halstedii]CEG48566.1 polyprotein [Plasmopara halstedii]|eukprot:XP_024584935.1 polyprotein [Plasmopara halstedii]
MKPENVARHEMEEWKAMVIVARILSPTYQSMIRGAGSAYDTWEMLRAFFVKQSLHKRAQLRKELHVFSLGTGGDLMKYIMTLDDLSSRMTAIGEVAPEDEKLVVSPGSLSQEYDAIIRIIEAHETVTLLDTKEMLCREFELAKKKQAFKASMLEQGVKVAVELVEATLVVVDSTRRSLGQHFVGIAITAMSAVKSVTTVLKY